MVVEEVELLQGEVVERLLQVEEMDLVAERPQDLRHVPDPCAGTGGAGVSRHWSNEEYLAHEIAEC